MTDDVKLPEPDLRDGVVLDFRGQYLTTKDGYTAATVRRLIAEAKAEERNECRRLCVIHTEYGRRQLLPDYIEAARNCAREIDNRSKA